MRPEQRTVKLRNSRLFFGQNMLNTRPGINDLAVEEGGENDMGELNLTVPCPWHHIHH